MSEFGLRCPDRGAARELGQNRICRSLYATLRSEELEEHQKWATEAALPLEGVTGIIAMQKAVRDGRVRGEEFRSAQQQLMRICAWLEMQTELDADEVMELQLALNALSKYATTAPVPIERFGGAELDDELEDPDELDGDSDAGETEDEAQVVIVPVSLEFAHAFCGKRR